MRRLVLLCVTPHSLPQPKNNGTCDVNIVLTVELTDDEVSSIVLDPKEYAESKWVDLDELITGYYHPAIQYSARSLKAHQTMQALRAAVSSNSSDSDVAALARNLVEISAGVCACGQFFHACMRAEACFQCANAFTRLLDTSPELKFGHTRSDPACGKSEYVVKSAVHPGYAGQVTTFRN